MRRFLTSIPGGSLSLAAAPPASAATVTTQNSCRWSYDNLWRHLDIDVSGVATPNPVAPGSGVTLTQASVHARLPDYLAEYGHGFGILRAGDNEIQAKVWVAIEAAGTLQGVQY